MMVELDDEVIAVIFIADGIGKRIRIAGRKKGDDAIERRADLRNREKGIIESDGASVRNVLLGRHAEIEVGADAFALPFVGDKEKSFVAENRAAERSAEVIVVEARLRVGRDVEKVARI